MVLIWSIQSTYLIDQISSTRSRLDVDIWTKIRRDILPQILRRPCLRFCPDADIGTTYIVYTIISPCLTRLVYLVNSAASHFDRRDTIRRTWGFENRFADVPIRTVFLLGRVPEDFRKRKKKDSETDRQTARKKSRRSVRKLRWKKKERKEGRKEGKKVERK